MKPSDLQTKVGENSPKVSASFISPVDMEDRSTSRPEVLLVSAPTIQDITFSGASSLYLPQEPLGLLYIASNLLEHGISCEFVDFNAEQIDLPGAVNSICKTNPKILGVSCVTAEAYLVEELLRGVREKAPEMKIVMGNIHSSSFDDYYLEQNIADIVVHGNGENVMVEVVKYFRSQTMVEDIPQVSYLNKNGKTERNSKVDNVTLDDLPMPAWHLLKPHLYKHHFYYNFNPDSTRIIFTSRGCPVGCAFCTIHDGMKVTYRSSEKVIEEMKFLIREFGTTHFNIQDPMFFAKKKRVQELCHLIIKEKLNVRLAAECHVNWAHEETLAICKQAGFETIYYGLEAGDDQLLKNIGKRTTCAQAQKAVAVTRKVGLKPVGFFMLGLPGETPELTEKTIDFSLSLNLDHAIFSIIIPLPGSELFTKKLQDDPDFDPMNWNAFNNTGALGKYPPVWDGKQYPYDLLEEKQRSAIRRFHLRPKYILRHLITLIKYGTWENFLGLVNLSFTIAKARASGSPAPKIELELVKNDPRYWSSKVSAPEVRNKFDPRRRLAN